MGFIHKTRPSGSFKPQWDSEIYTLRPRKKRAYPDNRILRLGYRHLLWSRYARVFYERIIDGSTLEDSLLYYRKQGILFLWPDALTIEEIRKEVEDSGFTYQELMWRRQNEMDWWDRHKSRPTGNGDKFWENYHRTELEKYLKKKK